MNKNRCAVLLSYVRVRTHIASTVKMAADHLGLYTCFETGGKTDAVIQDSNARAWAKAEWEWTPAKVETVNEIEKLASAVKEADTFFFVGYAHRSHATQDSTPRAVWNHAGHPGHLTDVDRGSSKAGRFPLSQQAPRLTAFGNSPVRPNSRKLGRRAGFGPRQLRNTFDATHESDTHLPANEEPAGRAVAPGALQARVDGAVSRHRG